MALSITISTNSNEIAKRFGVLAAKVRDSSPAYKALAVQLYGDTQRNFSSEGDTFMDRWAPLAESTLKQKARLGYTQPLVRTGWLRDTSWWDFSYSYAVIGYAADYASYLHGGTERMPARRLLPTQDWGKQRGVEVFEFYYKLSIKEAGL